ncbi:multidrug resistance protein [Ureibacillus xyleni]|uniref:Multidrug resistance protein n=1 Tax=Ureibacillus xyleni TaxID=614648 RepID=A0A285SDC1_9BACL|nr:MFS transporter [Ureibacillus xyleni]SOC05631.1 multidrug resistance protein [Ureibacillus xyleni]
MEIFKYEKIPITIMTIFLSWAGLIILISMYFTIPLTETWMSTFNIRETKAIWIGSIFSLCYALCCLIYGPLSDRFGRKIFLIFGISLLTIATFICAFIDSYLYLLIVRILQAIGAAAFVPISLVYIADVYPPQKRKRAFGFITSGFLIASVVAQLFASVINIYLGLRWIFIILGILYFITCILTIYLLPKEPPIKHKNSIFSNFLNIRNLLFNKQLSISFSFSFILLFALIGMYTIFEAYLIAPPFHFSEHQVFLARAVGLIGTVTCVLAGKISDIFGEIKTFRFSLAIASITLFLMAFTNNALFTTVFSLFFVASIALIVPINITLISQRAGEQKGTALLFNAFILFVGASVGPILATKLMQISYSFLAFSTFSTILLLGFFTSFLLKDEKSAP